MRTLFIVALLSLNACDLVLPPLHPRDNPNDELNTLGNKAPRLTAVTNTDNNKVNLKWTLFQGASSLIYVRTITGNNTIAQASTTTYPTTNTDINVYYYSTLSRTIQLQSGTSLYSSPKKVVFSQTAYPSIENPSQKINTDYGIVSQNASFFHFPSATTIPINNYNEASTYSISQDATKIASLSVNTGIISLKVTQNGTTNSINLFTNPDNSCFNNFLNPKNKTYLHFNPSGNYLGISCATGSQTGRLFVVNTQNLEVIFDSLNLGNDSINGLIRFSEDNRHLIALREGVIKTFDIAQKTVVNTQQLPTSYNYAASLNSKYLLGCSTNQCVKYERNITNHAYSSTQNIASSAFILPGNLQATHIISNDGKLTATQFKGSDQGFNVTDFVAVYNWTNLQSIQNYAVTAASLNGDRGIPLYIDENRIFSFAKQYPNLENNSIVSFPIQGTWTLE